MDKGKYNSFRTIGMQVAYRDFLKVSKSKSYNAIKQSLYTEILYRIFSKVFKLILFEAYKFKLGRIGKFSIVKYMPEIGVNHKGKIVTNSIVNSQATKVERERTGDKDVRIYYDNAATGGYIYRFIWERARTINLHYFNFKGRKAHRQELKDEILKGNVVANVINFKLKNVQ